MEQAFCLILLALVCGQTNAQNNGDIRLVGNSGTSGRLEIFIGNSWGTVCYDTSTDSRGAAQAACKQLGYSGYTDVNTVGKMGYQPGKGAILLSQVYCDYNSDIQHILRCSYTQVTNNCQHTLDMAITCSTTGIYPYDTAVRLVDGGTGFTSSGTVEVYLNNEWGTICSVEVTDSEADTICRQLGYTDASHHSSTQSPTSTRVWLDYVNCGTSEPCLNLCFTYPAATNTPTCSTVATVNCTFNMDYAFPPSAGSKALCTGYLTVVKHLLAIAIGAAVAFLLACLFFVLVPIICCCCCIPGCILHSCRERRVAYQVIQ